MALNLNSGGGDFSPYVKFNAKVGRWFKKEGDVEIEITNPTFIADFANIQTGWFLYEEGQAPNVVFDDSLSSVSEKPTDKHKRGFKIPLFSEKSFGGYVEFASASTNVCNIINSLYVDYEKDAPSNKGKLPVIQCTGNTPQKGKYGTNYSPILSIVKWVDIPQALIDANKTASPSAVTPKAAANSEF